MRIKQSFVFFHIKQTHQVTNFVKI